MFKGLQIETVTAQLGPAAPAVAAAVRAAAGGADPAAAAASGAASRGVGAPQGAQAQAAQARAEGAAAPAAAPAAAAGAAPPALPAAPPAPAHADHLPESLRLGMQMYLAALDQGHRAVVPPDFFTPFERAVLEATPEELNRTPAQAAADLPAHRAAERAAREAYSAAVKEVEALRQALELVEQERLALVEKYGPAVLAFVLKEGL